MILLLDLNRLTASRIESIQEGFLVFCEPRQLFVRLSPFPLSFSGLPQTDLESLTGLHVTFSGQRARETCLLDYWTSVAHGLKIAQLMDAASFCTVEGSDNATRLLVTCLSLFFMACLSPFIWALFESVILEIGILRAYIELKPSRRITCCCFKMKTPQYIHHLQWRHTFHRQVLTMTRPRLCYLIYVASEASLTWYHEIAFFKACDLNHLKVNLKS